MCREKLKTDPATVCIGNAGGASKSSNDHYTHNHQEPVDDWYIDLSHESLGCMDYLKPGKATKSHGLLYGGKGC